MKKNWLILLGLGISGIIVAIDFTIVNTCLPDIQHSLAASLDELQWIIVGFGIMFSSLLIPAGRLADAWGHRLMLYSGILGFALSSLVAGFSHSISMLIFARFLQGIFGSTVFPCGNSIISRTFDEKNRGKALGLYAGLIGVGLGFGPVLGGFINHIWSWRWVFFINIPIVTLSLLICLPNIEESKSSTQKPMDWFGILFVTIFVASLSYCITQLPDYGFNSLPIIATLVIAVVSLGVLIKIESKFVAPLLPPKLFSNRGFISGFLLFMVTVSLSWSVIFLAPLYLQNMMNFESTMVGLILLIMTSMTFLTPPLAGYLYDRKGASPVVVFIFLMAALSFVLQMYFTVDGPMWLVTIAFILFGTAWGMGNAVAVPLALESLENLDDVGVVTGSLLSAMNLVAVIILSFIGTVFRYVEKLHLFGMLADHKISLTQDQQERLRTMLADPEKIKQFLAHFKPEFANKVGGMFKESFMAGYHTSMLVMLSITVVAFVLMIKILPIKIKNT